MRVGARACTREAAHVFVCVGAHACAGSRTRGCACVRVYHICIHDLPYYTF